MVLSELATQKGVKMRFKEALKRFYTLSYIYLLLVLQPVKTVVDKCQLWLWREKISLTMSSGNINLGY